MKNVIDCLMAIQEVQWKTAKTTSNRAEQLVALRTQVPEFLLRTFDSFVARQKKPVAIVRNGVCSECHLQIAMGILGALAFGQGVQQCGNCGRFLYLPEDESVLARESSAESKRVPSKKRTAAHA